MPKMKTNSSAKKDLSLLAVEKSKTCFQKSYFDKEVNKKKV